MTAARAMGLTAGVGRTFGALVRASAGNRCYESSMAPPAFLAELVNAIPGWRVLARRSWCGTQRRRLGGRERKVVWVQDGKKMPWALWGADHGFFELDFAGRLPYLRAVAAVG
jgi:hypothetical protein